MAVRIRLTRTGRKKAPHYRIVVMDSRKRRDGAYLDQVGVYHPQRHPAQVEIHEEKVLHWLAQGAIPSDTVRSILSTKGIMLRHDLTKRRTPPEKIAEAVTRLKETAAARDSRRAGVRERKAKADSPKPEGTTDETTTSA